MLRLVNKMMDVSAPRPGILVGTSSFYTRATGTELMSRITFSSRSDTIDTTFIRFSSDNGLSWSELTPDKGPVHKGSGTERRIVYPGVINPAKSQLLFPIMQGTLPTDNPLEGLKQWTLRCGISSDAGRTISREEPLVQDGPGFSAKHPFPGVWVGKNSAMIGDKTSVPIWRKDGALLIPVQIAPLDEEGHLYNPGGGYTYHNAAVIVGTPNSAGKFRWRLSKVVSLDPALSTRGLLEPTLAELADGRILIVMRGSNDKRPELPGRKWYATSADGGISWSTPRPWGFTNSTAFFSPSSCSQLVPHSSGRLFWIGNICKANPAGNGPRYPLVMAEVDQHTLQLEQNSICPLDDRLAHESQNLTLSNFYAREDRVTGDIIVHCARFRASDAWHGDAFVYRITVK